MNTNISSNRMGIVSFKSTSHCGVILDGKEYLCQVSSRIKQSQPEKNTDHQNQVSARQMENLIVVGDRVNVLVGQGSQPMIIERLPRHNQLSRSTSSRPGGKLIEQVLASNVDQIVTVFAAANPEPKWNLLDRYLVMAEAVELPVWIVITKTDLVEQGHAIEQMNQQLAVYQKIGYPVLLTSSLQQKGIDELRSMFKEKNSVLIGKSGVGKTSLLNALMPGLDYRVSTVNEITGKGRHTTSAMRMLPLDESTTLIDSPGTREFGLWDIDPDDLDWYFKDMRPYLGNCKFKLDCQHEDEPGCAVRQAVVNGHIDPRRYRSYLRLKEDYLR
ncbi:MAG: ribosome small subunit-dependent GTPase A [Anaerolineaceae bacterium]|nr:ribosome small subunit-dependent GTPase A [Anaerolineaceae bacterium]